MDDRQRIRLLIGDVNYPLYIPRSDEQLYRDAARMINDMLNRYRETFPGLSKEQYLAMVALHNAYMNLEKKHLNDTAPFAERLEQSISLLTDYLAKEEE
ncbi:MAG: cell division protein ZapA [Bacteroidaceae bacterium]|nr:cell division protein ZapA [Bacteroidaceae bacterium]